MVTSEEAKDRAKAIAREEKEWAKFDKDVAKRRVREAREEKAAFRMGKKNEAAMIKEENIEKRLQKEIVSAKSKSSRKARAALKKNSLKVLKAIRRFGAKSIKKVIKEARRPTRSRPVPQQLRRPAPKKRTTYKPQFTQKPITVRDLQNAKSIKHLLTAEEQRIVERLFIGSRKAAAIQMVSRRMKEKEMVQERAMPRTHIERDIMTGREIVKREVPIERWMR